MEKKNNLQDLTEFEKNVLLNLKKIRSDVNAIALIATITFVLGLIIGALTLLP